MFFCQTFLLTTSSADGLGVAVDEGASSVRCAEEEDESAYAKLAIAMTKRKFAAPPCILTECFMCFSRFKKGKNRDSPDESQTGSNLRVFPALLQDRREVLTATSTSDSAGEIATREIEAQHVE